MRRYMVILLSVATAVTFYFTAVTMRDVFSSNMPIPAIEGDTFDQYRLVLITQELDSPFWKDVEQGAFAAAERNQVSLEAWGTFGFNEVDFLHHVEIAIASKVDGIIVQGWDNEEFKRLTKTRAASNGIPIITVVNDVPVNDSFRRTYVGSNHAEMGRMIARQLIEDMGDSGKVVLMVGDRQEHSQLERLAGILEVFHQYPGISSETITIGSTNEKAAAVINQILNQEPSTRAFISVNSNSTGVMVREINKRYRIEDFYLYSFDENPETLKLLRDGAIDALIAQEPHKMGELSVDLMVRWLEGVDLPLDYEGYFTDIKVLRAGDTR